MSERNLIETMPPPSAEGTRRDILKRVEMLRAQAAQILATAGDLVMIAERMPGGSVKPQ